VTRREFLIATSVAPALAALVTKSAEAAEFQHRAPYEALRQYILPGNDQFAGEQTASAIREALSLALRTGQLPLAAAASGSSICARAFEKASDDVSVAMFDSADTDIAGGWRRWVESLGDVRRAQFWMLPGGPERPAQAEGLPHQHQDQQSIQSVQGLARIRYEIASSLKGRLFHRVGFWRLG